MNCSKCRGRLVEGICNQCGWEPAAIVDRVCFHCREIIPDKSYYRTWANYRERTLRYKCGGCLLACERDWRDQLVEDNMKGGIATGASTPQEVADAHVAYLRKNLKRGVGARLPYNPGKSISREEAYESNEEVLLQRISLDGIRAQDPRDGRLSEEG